MDNKSNKLLNHHTTTERKTPSEKGVFDKSMLFSSTSTVANPFRIAKLNLHGGTDATPDGGGDPFPSLSKGTRLASKSITNTHTVDIQLQTLTKYYPDKIVFMQFKFPLSKREQKPENIVENPPIERTQEQIHDSIDSSLRRTRREIADIVDCNDFDKFATFTFDPKKHPLCKDYEYAKKIISKWLKNQQLTHGAFRYILVPERQFNGNIHFHALLGGFTGQYYPTNQRGNAQNTRQCYKIKSWESRYGFADMEDIGNKQATGRYIGKYITKDMTRTPYTAYSSISDPTTIGKDTEIVKKYQKRYFSSQNLKKPTKEYNHQLKTLVSLHNLDEKTQNRYENDYVIITTLQKGEALSITG